MTRYLDTANGRLVFPVFIPVTSYGGVFPLDELVRPYLSRYAQALMVSYHYAKAISTRPRRIVFIDSGGFASLFDGAEIVPGENYWSIRTKEGDMISPRDVLKLQEQHADIGATLDFIIPPKCPLDEAFRRQQATIRNALWALRARNKRSLRLFASVQAWDAASAHRIMDQLAPHAFDGFALGGMVPRIKAPRFIFQIVRAIRQIDARRPLHVFGVGKPDLVRGLFDLGVDSVDSSNYVRLAVDGKRVAPERTQGSDKSADPESCSCAVCARLGPDYLELEGEANRMALALHNLHVLSDRLGSDDPGHLREWSVVAAHLGGEA